MRKVESTQVELGGAFIGDIVIDAKSRDDIPALLRGLQHIYVSPAIRAKVFALLEAEVNPGARKDTGRPGMELWRILVLAILKQGLNCDYNWLAELANEHGTLRQHQHILDKVIRPSFNRVRTSKLIRKSPVRVEQYLAVCKKFLKRAKCTLNQVMQCESITLFQEVRQMVLQDYIAHARRQILIRSHTACFKVRTLPTTRRCFRSLSRIPAGLPKARQACRRNSAYWCVVED